MPIREVCSPVNAMKRPAPAPNAKTLKSVNPRYAHPSVQGKPAPAPSTPIDLPIASR
jgi:hypothetical protein